MAALKLANDENLAALGIRMGPRIRIMAAATAYQITESAPRKTTPAKSGGRVSFDSSDKKDVDSGDESDAGVLEVFVIVSGSSNQRNGVLNVFCIPNLPNCRLPPHGNDVSNAQVVRCYC